MLGLEVGVGEVPPLELGELVDVVDLAGLDFVGALVLDGAVVVPLGD